MLTVGTAPRRGSRANGKPLGCMTCLVRNRCSFTVGPLHGSRLSRKRRDPRMADESQVRDEVHKADAHHLTAARNAEAFGLELAAPDRAMDVPCGHVEVVSALAGGERRILLSLTAFADELEREKGRQ